MTPERIKELREIATRENPWQWGSLGYKCLEEALDHIEALRAEVARLKAEREQILLTVFGGEDAPGYAASSTLADVERVMDWWVGTQHYDQERNEALTTALKAIIDRSHNGSIGTSKVLDMRAIAEQALADRPVHHPIEASATKGETGAEHG